MVFHDCDLALTQENKTLARSLSSRCLEDAVNIDVKGRWWFSRLPRFGLSEETLVLFLLWGICPHFLFYSFRLGHGSFPHTFCVFLGVLCIQSTFVFTLFRIRMITVRDLAKMSVILNNRAAQIAPSFKEKEASYMWGNFFEVTVQYPGDLLGSTCTGHFVAAITFDYALFTCRARSDDSCCSSFFYLKSGVAFVLFFNFIATERNMTCLPAVAATLISTA